MYGILIENLQYAGITDLLAEQKAELQSLVEQLNANSERASGVTRVDVTRGGNWLCHPIFFFKLTTFLVIAL